MKQIMLVMIAGIIAHPGITNTFDIVSSQIAGSNTGIVFPKNFPWARHTEITTCYLAQNMIGLLLLGNASINTFMEQDPIWSSHKLQYFSILTLTFQS